MGWQQMLTEFYNFTKQSVEKIVKTLTLEKGKYLSLNWVN